MATASAAAWTAAQSSELRAGWLRSVSIYAAVALIAAFYLVPFVRVLTGSPDEGIYLYDAQRAAEGAIPGRDFLQENAPGAYYWIALFFRAFGTTVITARVLLLFTGVGTTLLMFHLARRAGSSGIWPAAFVLITSIPLMTINSPHYDSNFFGLAAFAVFLIGADGMLQGSAKKWPFLFSGLLAGWVSCILQQKGALLLCAFILSMLLLHGRRGIYPAVLMIAGFSAALTAEIAPYVACGAVQDLFFSSVKGPLAGYNGLNHVPYGYPIWTSWFPSLFAQLHANGSLVMAVLLLTAVSLPFVLLLVLPLAVAGLGFVCRSNVFTPRLIPYWIAAYALWLSEFHRRDLNHLRHGSLLLVLLFFLMCERAAKPAMKRVGLSVVLGTGLMGVISMNSALAASHPVVTRRGTLMAQRKDAVMEFLLSHTRPGDYVFVHPYAPVYYFLADVRNPTRLAAIVDQRDNPIVREAIRDLDSKKPRYALQDTHLTGDHMRNMFPAFRPPPPGERTIDRYLDQRYHQIGMADGFRVLERNEK